MPGAKHITKFDLLININIILTQPNNLPLYLKSILNDKLILRMRSCTGRINNYSIRLTGQNSMSATQNFKFCPQDRIYCSYTSTAKIATLEDLPAPASV